jgi:hypothetical protein
MDKDDKLLAMDDYLNTETFDLSRLTLFTKVTEVNPNMTIRDKDNTVIREIEPNYDGTYTLPRDLFPSLYTESDGNIDPGLKPQS